MISHGHRYGEVLEYTLDQFNAFLEAIDRQEQEQQRQHLETLILALRGSQDREQLKQIIDRLYASDL